MKILSNYTYPALNNHFLSTNSKKIKTPNSNYQNTLATPNYRFFPLIDFKGQQNETLRSEILQAVKTQEPLSNDGLKGVVYKFEKDGNTYAVKIGRSKDSDFSQEAEVLKNIPNSLASSQKLVDYFKDFNDKDVLVSTFAAGKKGVLSSREDFDKFFNILISLDKAGVLHGDLNMANCLFDGNKINIIDYGEGSIFHLGDIEGELYPNFVAKSNVINLEHNGIPDCIKKWHGSDAQTKTLFKEYLQAKGIFYGKHANLLEKNQREDTAIQECIKYERNLAKVLKNPSDKVLENEARRMNILYTFEHADTSVNYTKIPDDAVRNWNDTVALTASSISFIEKQIADSNISPDEKLYFRYQEKLLKSLYNNFSDWSKGTIQWIEGLKDKPISEMSEHELDLHNNQGKNTEAPPNLVSYIF